MKRIFSTVVALSMVILTSVHTLAEENDINRTAIDEAKQYLSGDVTISSGNMSSYTAADGTEVMLEWDNVYDCTIKDEKGMYRNDTYLKSDGKITRPKWFEGTKKLKGDAKLTAGSETDEVSDVHLTLQPPSAPNFQNVYDYLTDYIDIGNTDSEMTVVGTNRINRLEVVRDNGIQTKNVEGVEHTYRTLNKNGAMVVTMKCDSEKTNYLTVKLWGDDTGDTMLWVCDPTSGNMNITNSSQPSRDGLVDRRDWVELNFLNASPQYNGGFIYSTYMIPKIYTEGKDYVSLRIYSTGGNANYGNITIKEQTEPSRGIYAAYMTQDADFDPSKFETVTGKHTPTAKSDMMPYSEQKELALKYTKSAVETFKSWQIYGMDNYPSYMEGMVTRGTSWKNKAAADTNWKDCYYSCMMTQNLTPLNINEIFAYAYKKSDELGYTENEKTELLDRVVKGIDFLTRAQGENGGFYSSEWIGGPSRKVSESQHLTGFGLRSVAQAMIMICDDVDFYEVIDSDADCKTDLTRLEAWSQMAAKARDYLVSLDGAGHAPNQDMVNIVAALRFEKALQLMDSDLSWKTQRQEDNIEKYLDIALGFSINNVCSSYWVSPKGLILENFGSIQGGYSGDYGTEALEEMSQLTEFAEENLQSDRAKKYIERMKNAYSAIDNFMFTANAEIDGNPTLYAEGLTGNRNAYYPGTERYILDEYNAVEKGNKTALKTYELFFEHNKLLVNAESYTPLNSHFEDNALAVIKMYINFDKIISKINEENIIDYDYIMDDDSQTSYAWADEMGRNVVIKNGDERIYLALNWRNPLHSQTYYNTADSQNQQKSVMNNLVRVHHTTDLYDKYGYAEMKTEGWNVKTAESSDWQLFENHYVDAFMYMNYGDYAIIMNSNNLMGNENDLEYDIPIEKLGLDGVYEELISGEYYYFGETADGAVDGSKTKIPSATTFVLKKINPMGLKAKVKNADYADGYVTVRMTKDDGYKDIVQVYVAEYDNDGKLAEVKCETRKINSDTEIKFGYKKKNPDSAVKIMIWDENMQPYEWE